MSVGQKNVKWVDGLRGIASLLVVFTHLAHAFDEDLFKPTSGEHAAPRLLQYPIIRVLVQGRIGISIFSLIIGYVCALKPIRQCTAGNQDAALSGIAKSAFRRIPRVILPTSIATIFIWFICQFGAFEIASTVEGWLKSTSPNSTPYIGDALKILLLNMITTWTYSWNNYDTNQWTLLSQLKGAFLVYVMLFATAYMKPRFRMTVEIGLFVYYYISNDSAFGMQFFFGAFLSDLSHYAPHVTWVNARDWPSRFLSPILILVGLLLASYPEQEPEGMSWSNFMLNMSTWIFPNDSETARFYSSLGLEFMALGIHFSNPVKNALSNKHLLWFGKNSFAVYLLHGTFIRTLLAWMLFGISAPADVVQEIGEQSSPNSKIGRLRWYFWLPIWFVILYTCANLWTKHIDPFCARLTQKLEEYVFEDKDTPQETMLKLEAR